MLECQSFSLGRSKATHIVVQLSYGGATKKHCSPASSGSDGVQGSPYRNKDEILHWLHNSKTPAQAAAHPHVHLLEDEAASEVKECDQARWYETLTEGSQHKVADARVDVIMAGAFKSTGARARHEDARGNTTKIEM